MDSNDTIEVLAIDPGLKGAIVGMNAAGKILLIADTPTEKVKTSRKSKLGNPIKKNLYLVNDLRDIVLGANPKLIAYERQHAMPGQGVSSMFTTGYGMGLLDMMVSSLCIPATVITAQEWTKHMLAGSTGDGKERAVSVARALYPNEPHLCKSNGRADAICIARYILAKNSGSLRTRIADSRA